MASSSAKMRVMRTGTSGPTGPSYEPGDYVKVEFSDATTGIGEWMWVRVHHSDDEKRVVCVEGGDSRIENVELVYSRASQGVPTH